MSEYFRQNYGSYSDPHPPPRRILPPEGYRARSSGDPEFTKDIPKEFCKANNFISKSWRNLVRKFKEVIKVNSKEILKEVTEEILKEVTEEILKVFIKKIIKEFII